MPNSSRRGITLAVVASTLFALNGTVSKSILESGLDSAHLAELRVTVAFGILAVVIAVKNPRAFSVRAAEWPGLLAFGLLGITFTQLCYFIAISHMDISIALLLEYTAPILVTLYWRYGLRRAVASSVWLGLALALLGLSLVAQLWGGFHLNVVGVMGGLGAACALSVYFVVGDRQVRAPFNRDPLSLTMWGFGLSAAFFAVVRPWWNFPWSTLWHPRTPAGLATHGIPVWVLCVYMIVFGTVLSFWIEMAAVQQISAAQVSVIALLEPALASIFAWIILGEVLSGWQLLGGVLVLSGVYVAERSR